MKNVTDLADARRPCPYCGAKKACPDFTCPRIASVRSDDTSWQIEFAEDWKPPQNDDSTTK